MSADWRQFRFNLKAANGKIILTSESYKTKGGAGNGIASVKTNAPDDGRYERKTAGNGEPYFVLKAANGEPLGRSENYSLKRQRRPGLVEVNSGIAEELDLPNAPRLILSESAGCQQEDDQP